MDQNKINQFTTKARAAGYNDAQIASEIARKKKELEATVKPQTPAVPSGGMDISNPGFAGETPTTPVAPKPKKTFGEKVGSFLNKATDFFAPRMKKYVQEEGERLKKPMSAKQRLYESIPVVNLFSNMKDNGQLEFDKSGMAAAGEVASYLVPVSKVAKGAKLGAKVLAGAKLGAKVGTIQGLTTPNKEITDIEGRVKEGLVNAGFGAMLGGTLSGAYELPKELIKKSLSGASNVVRGIFKVAPSEMRKFRKVNGMDFGEEILAREGKTIAGMGYNEIADHMASKKDQAQKVVADALKGTKEKIDTPTVIKAIDEKISALAPEKGNVNTEGAIATLESIRATLEKNPKTLTLEVANNLKRQLQEAGAIAFSPTGKPTPSSGAFADVSAVLRKMIEDKVPGVKEGNNLIQLYHLAGESILKQGDAAVNRVASGNLQKFIQNIPAVAGAGIGFGVGGLPGGVAGLIGGEIISGLQGTIRNKFLSPEVQSRMAASIQKGLEGIQKPTTQQVKSVTNRVVQEVIKQLSRSVTSGAGATQPVQETQNNQLTPDNQTQETQQLQHTSSITQPGLDINKLTFQTQETQAQNLPPALKYSLTEHLQALAAATANGDKAAIKEINANIKIRKDYDEASGGEGKPLSGANSVLLNKANTASKAVDKISTSLIDENGKYANGKLWAKKLNPLSQEGRQLGADIVSAIDILGYFRTGAAITADQRKDYIYMFPNELDSKETVQKKIKALQEEFAGYAKGISASGGSNSFEDVVGGFSQTK